MAARMRGRRPWLSAVSDAFLLRTAGGEAPDARSAGQEGRAIVEEEDEGSQCDGV